MQAPLFFRNFASWIGIFFLLFTGCTTQRSSSSSEVLDPYIPLSELKKRFRWEVYGKDGKVICRDSQNQIVFLPGKSYFISNSRTYSLSAPVYTLGGEVYIPRRFLRTYDKLRPVVFSPPAPTDSKAASSPSRRRLSPSVLPSVPLPSSLQPRAPLTKRWRYIVIHHSSTPSGNAEIFHRFHLRRGWQGLGYHFVIGNGTRSGDGEVEVGFRWRLQKSGAHAGNRRYNRHGIGICLVGNFQRTSPTPKQIYALSHLVAYLMLKYRIPLTHVLPHWRVRRGHTLCPGKKFPWSRFIRYVRASLAQYKMAIRHFGRVKKG
ncbi:MAG: hypothetical protein D6805_03655 [Planctomycetota bacterium]|nr:MAG: hypothetical protein D6805_03655 [Planctomycetota bacterium]